MGMTTGFRFHRFQVFHGVFRSKSQERNLCLAELQGGRCMLRRHEFCSRMSLELHGETTCSEIAGARFSRHEDAGRWSCGPSTTVCNPTTTASVHLSDAWEWKTNLCDASSAGITWYFMWKKCSIKQSTVMFCHHLSLPQEAHRNTQ